MTVSTASAASQVSRLALSRVLKDASMLASAFIVSEYVFRRWSLDKHSIHAQTFRKIRRMYGVERLQNL